MTSPPRGERRLAALLFADLSGYTKLCRTLDPEDVAATVLPLLAEVRSAVTAVGGLATGVAGDGFLAVFGVPQSDTDVADRAARAALEMRRIVRSRSIEWNTLAVPDIHIGLTAGEVLAFPSDDPSGLSFIGPAINLAARLSDAARAGSILVDEHCRRLMSDKACLKAAGELVLQGHEDGVQVWELAFGDEVAVKRSELPFVGRDELLQRLDQSWPLEPAPTIPARVHLVGEAGIGKTSVARQWLARQPETASVWLNCVDVPFGEHVARLLRQLRVLAGEEVDPRVPLPTAVSDGLPARPEEDDRLRAREAVQLLNELRSPLAIVLDDYQDADDELRDLVGALSESHAMTPVIVLCASRVDEAGADNADGSDLLVVPPLDHESVLALVTATLGADAPQVVTDVLVNRAEGRPLAVLHTSAYLIETGTVSLEGDSCTVRAPERLADLPDSLRLFVAGRLDRLPPTEKQLVQELSAVGTVVPSEVIERLFGAARSDPLSDLVSRGFLVRDESDVRFSHGVVHEVAYASLPRSVRARLHRRMVEEDASRDDATRALHARRWAASATETAPGERRLAIASALHHTRAHAETLFTAHVRNAYAEARTVRPLLDEDADVAPADAARLHVLLARCDIHAGRYDEALSGAGRAVALTTAHALDPSIKVAALCAQGEALSMLRHYQSARQALEGALQSASDSRDDVGRGRALRLLGETYRHSDSMRLLALTEEAFDVFVSCKDEAGAAEAARTMAYWLSVNVAPRLQRWIDEAERRTPADDVRGRLELARTRAFAAGARLDHATAREQGAICRALGSELGVGEVIVDGLIVGIESAAALGLLEESLALLAEFEDYAKARGEPRLRQMAAVFGLQPLQRAGLGARAKEAATQIVALRDAFGPPEAMMARAALGLTSRDRGDWSPAIEQLTEALGASDEAGFSLTSIVLRCELALTSCFLGVTPADAEIVIDLSANGGAPAIASLTTAALALLADDTLPAAAGVPTLQEAAIRADAAALSAERNGGDARASWEHATSIWQQLGYTVFLARAQARSGDTAAAEQTLDAIQASDEGRAWALQR